MRPHEEQVDCFFFLLLEIWVHKASWRFVRTYQPTSSNQRGAVSNLHFVTGGDTWCSWTRNESSRSVCWADVCSSKICMHIPIINPFHFVLVSTGRFFVVSRSFGIRPRVWGCWVLGAMSSLWCSTRQMVELLISCYCVHDDYHCDPTHGFPATMIDMQIILHAKAYLPNESMMWHLPRLFFMLIIRQSELIVVGACKEWRNRRCHYH